MDYREECQLPIRRQRGLWLVNKIEAVSAETVAKQRQKRLAMRLLMQRAAAVGANDRRTGFLLGIELLDLGREVVVALGPEEEPIADAAG